MFSIVYTRASIFVQFQFYFSHFRGFGGGLQYPPGDVMRIFPFSCHISSPVCVVGGERVKRF